MMSLQNEIQPVVLQMQESDSRSTNRVLLVLIAFGLGAPLANLAMNRWLEGFAYRITPGAGIFLFTGSVALLVALISVGVHALRTALANPVRSLRYE